jgi:hypothetical protein
MIINQYSPHLNISSSVASFLVFNSPVVLFVEFTWFAVGHIPWVFLVGSFGYKLNNK